MERRTAKCHNCKFSGRQFRINKLTHLTCQDPKQYTKEKFDNNEYSPWDALRLFSDTCDNHEFKN